MLFLIGFILGLASLLVIRYFIKEDIKTFAPQKIRYSQSYVYTMISPAIPLLNVINRVPLKTQASELQKKLMIKVLILDNKAYWIKNNAVYSAETNGDRIDKETEKVVDIMGMDDIQLKRIMFIIEKLTEGNEDDSSNTGYPKL